MTPNTNPENMMREHLGYKPAPRQRITREYQIIAHFYAESGRTPEDLIAYIKSNCDEAIERWKGWKPTNVHVDVDGDQDGELWFVVFASTIEPFSFFKERMRIINEAEEAERQRLMFVEENRKLSEEVMADSMARLEREKQEALLLKEDSEFAEYERLKQKFKLVEKHK